MTAITTKEPSFNDAIMLKLAREIAMDMRPLDEILALYEVDNHRWQEIQTSQIFKGYLRGALEEWNSATNTQERVRMKALFMVEESLPEFYARLHDADEALQHKTEVFKTITKLAGLEKSADAGTGERLTVTINLGADNQLQIEKTITPQGNLIDAEQVEDAEFDWEEDFEEDAE